GVGGGMVAGPVGTAAGPRGAAVAAGWLERVARSDGATVLAGARELSDAERDEIRRVARRLWRRPLPYAIGLTLWLAIPLTFLLLGHRFTADLERARFAFLAVITLAVDLRFFSSLRSARLLERDAGAGRVMI